MHLQRALIALGVACVPLSAQGECTPADIATPARGSTLHDARPEIAWVAVPGARTYRVQIESRVPEGRVIERIDAQVSGTRFVPPRPLAERKAAVKLLVTASCAESPSVAPQAAWFFIDAAAKCAAVVGLAFTGATKAEWTRTRGATSYEVSVYSLADGRLVAQRESTLASAEFPRGDAPRIVAVRPRCGAIVGEAAYGLPPTR